MKSTFFRAAVVANSLAVAALFSMAPAHSHDVKGSTGKHIVVAQTVVPKAEKTRAQELLASGPKKTSGIAGVKVIGKVSLDGEFKSSDGLQMRVRELVIKPGGIVAVHQHKGRPGAAYIIEGEMTEHRSSEKAPIVKKAGQTAMERSGVIHWWENTGAKPARALVVDIVPAK